jgi:hypothetical protein
MTTFKRLFLLVPALLAPLLAFGAAPALAAPSGPGWAIRSAATPTNFSAEDTNKCDESYLNVCDAYYLTVTNVGDAPSNEGEPVIVRDRLPRGIAIAPANDQPVKPVSPEGEYGEVHCTERAGSSAFTCEFIGGAVVPGGSFVIGMEVIATPEAASEVTNFAEVQGGGAPASVTAPPATESNTVDGATPPAFGIQDFSVGVFGADGQPDVQAGDHPASIATTIDFTTVIGTNQLGERADKGEGANDYPAVQDPKDEIVDLPLGFVGDPLAAPRCPEINLDEVQLNPSRCPAGSQVGIANIYGGDSGTEGKRLYNVVPEAGYPAEFGFEFDETIVLLRARVVPSAGGYMLSVAVPDLPRATTISVTGATIVFFGNPTEVDGAGNDEAFLTNPDACGSPPLKARLETDSWVQPQRWVSAETPVYGDLGQGVTGCNLLQFEPTVEVKPEESTADTPSGYEVSLKVPQAENHLGLLATPDLKNAVVSFPAGVSVSPSAANGLVACQETGPQGINITHGWTPTGQEPLDEKDPEAMEVQADGLPHVAPGHCPLASQIGEVEVSTPILAAPLKGHVYIAEPQCGEEGQAPCTPADASDGRLFGIYLEISGSGIIVKLKGDVTVNTQTGQLTTSFTENPQFPFSELKLKLNGGPRAPLANPQSCGSFTATSDLTPWSTPVTPDATPSASFPVAGCTNAFAPAFNAGTTNTNAGAYSPFTLTFSRRDGEQDLSGLTVNMPPGLVGKIAGISECPEAEANAGTCPAASRVGTATAAAGAGADPYWQSGPVYLTGPYNGAPFGLSVVVPANAGPYHLGNIVTRAAIHINPETAAVTVVSNPLPQMIDGVPLRVQTVNVTVGEGDDFTFNPTSCSQESIGATISSAQGASVGVSSGFQATGCASLPFKPGFSASTVGKASKADGASLDLKVTSSAGQANIAKLDLEIPKQLPSRLTTLQKACTEAQFNANPAGCPSASDVGTAKVFTPVLGNPLAGPIYLVSHGGAAFPDVEVILQGEGVQIVMDGKTQIKNGVTYSHFETVPDAPFTSFEAKLPTGKYSIFGSYLPAKAGYSFCGQSLSLPVTLTGQNGAVLKQTAKVGVTGCPKAKTAVKKKAKKKKAKAKKATKSNRRAK